VLTTYIDWVSCVPTLLRCCSCTYASITRWSCSTYACLSFECECDDAQLVYSCYSISVLHCLSRSSHTRCVAVRCAAYCSWQILNWQMDFRDCEFCTTTTRSGAIKYCATMLILYYSCVYTCYVYSFSSYESYYSTTFFYQYYFRLLLLFLIDS
jgi:hypothetical protein